MRTLAAGFGFVLVLLASPARAEPLPASFVYLSDVDPSIAQDMRYASSDNFTGHPLPGYGPGECVLRRDVAQALAKVQADLARQNLGLKVYDCYRPTRAVRAFARWARQSDDGATKRFYPKLDKRTLFDGYIAAHSAHSTGSAVDLTLVPRPTPPAPPYDPRAAYGACTAPADKRAPDTSLDMGTSFDCFDAKSTALSSTTTSEQNHRRVILLEAMRKRGFHNYFREWWHFSFGARGPAFDFPIGPRSSSTSP
ncbi:MAG TPA: M15 family metallopeptidase [Pseudolabrys sp.]|jgi:D-alanyl-D-alanine dipeptidase